MESEEGFVVRLSLPLSKCVHDEALIGRIILAHDALGASRAKLIMLILVDELTPLHLARPPSALRPVGKAAFRTLYGRRSSLSRHCVMQFNSICGKR